MIGIDEFPMPNDLIDAFLDNKITKQEFLILTTLYRKTYGGPSPELVKDTDISQISAKHKYNWKSATRTLKEKGLVDTIYLCSNCNHKIVVYEPTNYRCGNCKSEETPQLYYILMK